MAHIKKRKRKKGTVYKAEVRLRGHQYISRTFRKLSEAREWAKHTEKKMKLTDLIKEETSKEHKLSALADQVEQLKNEIQQIKKKLPQDSSE